MTCVSPLTAAQVHDKEPVQVLVVDKSCMQPGAGLVVKREVTLVLVASKEIVLLVVNQEFLGWRDVTTICHHVTLTSQYDKHVTTT